MELEEYIKKHEVFKMEVEEYIKKHEVFNELKIGFKKFVKEKGYKYRLDSLDCRFEKNGVHLKVQIYIRKKKIINKKV